MLALVACRNGSSEDPQKRSPPLRPLAPLPIPLDQPAGPLAIEHSGFPCDVEEVLKVKCRRCHTEPARFGAPFSLLSWEVTQTSHQNQPIYARMGHSVQSGFMPYQGAPANPPVAKLSDEEKQIIVRWAAAGGPRGNCGEAPAPSAQHPEKKPRSPRPAASPSSRPKPG